MMAASIRTALVTGTLKDMEIFQLHFEQAYLMAYIDTEIYQ